MKKYSGFTLIEMLIVMGIIIILMAAGIAGGRFALQRANRIQKISAADNLEQALWGYYTDNRGFPTDPSATPINPETLLSTYIGDYIDAGAWDGGSDGSFYYFYAGNGQEFVVCASLGGIDDNMGIGIYCGGNGLVSGNIAPFNTGSDVPADNIYTNTHPDYAALSLSASSKSNWIGDTRSWE